MYKKYLTTVAFFMVIIFTLLGCEKGTDSPTQTIPVLTTTIVTGLSSVSANSGGNIASDGGASVTSRGVCWGTNQTPTITDSKTTNGTGSGVFTSSITGLAANTTYYVRAYATNSVGTGYGSAVSFTTLSLSENTVTDIDGNVYQTVRIGNQVWMAENLKVTKYKDGETIPYVASVSAWGSLATPGFCWTNNDISYKNSNGGLYNWYVVHTGKLAPEGWHIPTDAEWKILAAYLGGESIAGGKMKAVTRWGSPNVGGTNSSGFNAFPVDYRNYDGVIFQITTGLTSYWASDQFDNSYAYSVRLTNDSQELIYYHVRKTYGYSVRCIKD